MTDITLSKVNKRLELRKEKLYEHLERIRTSSKLINELDRNNYYHFEDFNKIDISIIYLFINIVFKIRKEVVVM